MKLGNIQYCTRVFGFCYDENSLINSDSFFEEVIFKDFAEIETVIFLLSLSLQMLNGVA